MKYVVNVGEKTYQIDINQDDRLTIDGRAAAVDFECIDGDSLYSLLLDQQSYETFVEEHEGRYEVLLFGRLYSVDVQDELRSRLMRGTSGFAAGQGEIAIRAPMPGLIVKVAVDEGQGVHAGQTVVVLESMKMENELKAPRDGVVSRVRVKARESVERNQVLVNIT